MNLPVGPDLGNGLLLKRLRRDLALVLLQLLVDMTLLVGTNPVPNTY